MDGFEIEGAKAAGTKPSKRASSDQLPTAAQSSRLMGAHRHSLGAGAGQVQLNGFDRQI